MKRDAKQIGVHGWLDIGVRGRIWSGRDIFVFHDLDAGDVGSGPRADLGIGTLQQSRAIGGTTLPRRMVQVFDLTPMLRCHLAESPLIATYSILSKTDSMANSSSPDTTQLLRAWADGDSQALEQLTPRVYRELRRVAAQLLQNERPGHTLQSTDLVHEVYLRLVNAREVEWQHRAHFFAVSAQIMRHILLDRARRRVAAKRGGAAARVNLDEVADIGSGRARETIALDDALNALAKVDPRKARVIEMRFFAGLTVEETAEVLQVSSDTVKRDWRLARAWLLAELGDPRNGER
jgi:RNA polymerase sigma factor (TIGR02999 family)